MGPKQHLTDNRDADLMAWNLAGSQRHSQGFPSQCPRQIDEGSHRTLSLCRGCLQRYVTRYPPVDLVYRSISGLHPKCSPPALLQKLMIFIGDFFCSRESFRVPQKEVGKRSSITLIVFGTVSVTFLVTFSDASVTLSSLVCQS